MCRYPLGEKFHLSVYLIINSSVMCGHRLVLVIVLLARSQSSVKRVEISENKALGEICAVPKNHIIIFLALVMEQKKKVENILMP